MPRIRCYESTHDAGISWGAGPRPGPHRALPAGLSPLRCVSPTRLTRPPYHIRSQRRTRRMVRCAGVRRSVAVQRDCHPVSRRSRRQQHARWPHDLWRRGTPLGALSCGSLGAHSVCRVCAPSHPWHCRGRPRGVPDRPERAGYRCTRSTPRLPHACDARPSKIVKLSGLVISDKGLCS